MKFWRALFVSEFCFPAEQLPVKMGIFPCDIDGKQAIETQDGRLNTRHLDDHQVLSVQGLTT